ncbi:Hypothetical protein FKW44_001402, partial [Caligus rogercresseyi]
MRKTNWGRNRKDFFRFKISSKGHQGIWRLQSIVSKGRGGTLDNTKRLIIQLDGFR